MTTLEEIYGYIPVPKSAYRITDDMNVSKVGDDDNSEYFALEDNFFNVTGKQIISFVNDDTKEKEFKHNIENDIVNIIVPANQTYTLFNCIITYAAKYRTTKAGDDGTNIAPVEFTQTARTTTSCKILVNQNYEIIETFPKFFSIPFRYAKKETNNSISILSQSNATSSIVDGNISFNYVFKLGIDALDLSGKTSIINNISDNDSGDEINKKIMEVSDSLLDQIGDEVNNITNGLIIEEKESSVDGTTNIRWRWSGDKTLDKLTKVLHSQLDILAHNYNVASEVLANLYGTLFPKVLELSINRDLSLVQAKTQVLSSLAQLTKTQQDNILSKVRAKLYYVQIQALKAENEKNLFIAQYEGASTAFSASVVDYQPRINTDEELMSMYGAVKSQFNGF